jgi:GMP synthase-like glutamine amidotransferase
MMRNYSVSDKVRRCFQALNCEISIYKYDDPHLYEIIKRPTSPSHWFFTGNGPDFVTDLDAPAIDERIYKIRSKMMFFICYSHQLIAAAAGCTIWHSPRLISGKYPIRRLPAEADDPIFNDIPVTQVFCAYHRQYFKKDCIPPGWKILALRDFGADSYVAFMKHGCNMYSSQVHPEFYKSTYKMIDNWLSMRP